MLDGLHLHLRASKSSRGAVRAGLQMFPCHPETSRGDGHQHACLHLQGPSAGQDLRQENEVRPPISRAGYVCFLLRDLLANAGGFTIPPLLQPSLGAVAAQLAGPALVNLITSPIHFLALDLYNNPDASGSERLRTVGGSYVGATSSRIMKGLAAYGIGGLTNTALRGRVGLPAFEFAATMTRNEL